MSAKTYTEGVTYMARMYVDNETAARKALAEDLTSDHAFSISRIEEVMRAAATAKPWRTVLRLIEERDKTVAQAIAAVRKNAVETLLTYGESRSTSDIRNEEERVNREGLRSFLSRTEGVIENIAEAEAAEQAKAEEEPAAAEEAPAAPRPTGKKPSPAQLAALRVIKTGHVVIRELGFGRPAAFGPHGRENLRVIKGVIAAGWAEQDASTSLYSGQKVVLTEAGAAHLA
ncbi:hypothetical protein SUDANB1_05634 [Streptomyces sp. enrichment culture]|uniref:hypothetical protein n=1 Tax=Streptomyces sp. enrichment culture TaxID=1795815 RepID=UPI003F565E92